MSKQIATAAEDWMSRNGHVSHDSVDCSHFLLAVLNASVAPHFRYLRADEYLTSPSFSLVTTPEAGDLVHWPGHIAVVINPTTGTFIGSQTSTGVDLANYKTNPYWSGRTHRVFLHFNGR